MRHDGPSASLFHVKHSVRFIDRQAAELGLYAQTDLDAYADLVRRAFAGCPPRLDKEDPRLELIGRIIYDARKIDAYNGGTRALWQ